MDLLINTQIYQCHITIDRTLQSDLINIGTCLGRCLHVRNTPLACSALRHVNWDLAPFFQVHLVADQQKRNPLITLHTKNLLPATIRRVLQ